MNAIIRSLTTTYERAGKKGNPKVLVLHGWGDDAAGWQDMQTRLSAQYDVLVVDLPGFGATPAPPEAWDLNDYAAFVSEFLKELRFRPDTIIGHSSGGAIAVRGLAEDLLLANRLVLLDSAGLRSAYRGHAKAVRVLTRTGKVFSYALPRNLRKRLRHSVYKTLGPDVNVQDDLKETFKRIVTDDIQSSAARLQLPTLIIYGEDDEATPVQYGRILHSLIDNSTFETVTGAGHFVHLDKPDAVETALKDFIG